jgi:hypothetical protein
MNILFSIEINHYWLVKMSQHVDELFVEIKQLPYGTQMLLAKELKVAAIKERIAGLSPQDKAKLTEQLANDHKNKQQEKRKAKNGLNTPEGKHSDKAGSGGNSGVEEEEVMSSSDDTPLKDLAMRKKKAPICVKLFKSSGTKTQPAEKESKKRTREEDAKEQQPKRPNETRTCGVCSMKGHTMRACPAVKQLRQDMQEHQELEESSSSSSIESE